MAAARNPTARSAFYSVLSEAIAEFTEHGFDSQERLDFWMQRLRETARTALMPEYVLQRELRDNLSRIYTRLVDKGGLLRMHPGISQYTIANIKPKLRLELDRHILASASLIKLNRDVAVEETIKRLAGWVTSIPAGGSDITNRREVASEVRRGIAGLPFVERRVIIDQGHKLSAGISRIVATDGGAIGGYWRHVAEGPPAYDSRPEHVARDGKFYVLRDNWAMHKGLMKLAGRKYYDEITAAGQEVFCRCSMVWQHNLRDIPQEMLTSKGKEELARVRAQIARMKA
jgi:hypothetical protein